ncbi:MAG: thermonuclease family protein [Gallionella sp.]|nr:thermonuclease family protein [Gallionella sp.]
MLPFILATCLVVGVSDGDTLTALCQNHQQVRVRLAEIDAPEKDQPFGQRSKQSLSEICFMKTADLQVQATDRYKRTVARVTCSGVDVNAEQIRRGMAWVYDKYNIDKSLYPLQSKAQAAHRGLWTDPNPVTPWDWRRARKKGMRTTWPPHG